MSELYIGLMTGTSIDAIDIVLVDFQKEQCRLVASSEYQIDHELSEKIHRLCNPLATIELNQHGLEHSFVDPIDLMGQVDSRLGELFAEVVNQFLREQNVSPTAIKAIGSHGQTIRHRPSMDNIGGNESRSTFTYQIGDPNRIAYGTGIATVADFRRMDMACGGQGAPLVPAFHRHIFQHEDDYRIILNLGGIANITLLPPLKRKYESIIGFDTGPANTLLDAHYRRHHPRGRFDTNGQFAAAGRIDDQLLQNLCDDPYFKKSAPKSTGREYFSINWLQRQLDQIDRPIAKEDIQRTLVALTVNSVTEAIKNTGVSTATIYVCGGGAHNEFLMAELANASNREVCSTNDIGVDSDYVEAMTFAWLAKQRLERLSGNLPSVTGAAEEKVLGALYLP